VLGFIGLRHLDVTAMTLSTLIGLAIIFLGLAYILAVAGVNRFEKEVKEVRGSIVDALK